VRLGLVLSEVGEKNQVKVADEEVERALVEQVRRFPGQEKAVWDYYQQNPQAMAQLRAPLFEDKVIDYILELAEVKEIKVSREELFHDHTHDGEHAHEEEKKPAKKKAAPKKKAAAKKAE
jgi:trigger factor